MQTVPVLPTMDNPGRALRSGRLSVGTNTLGERLPRCQRCDIPLGSYPCPNPQCHEPHGQSAGTLCTWCADHLQERLEGLDGARVHTMEAMQTKL